jgi:hypothetical protein
VDRTRAKSNITSGLLIGAIAIGVFGLGFLVSALYIH